MTDKESQFDMLCKNLNIQRRFIPATEGSTEYATPQFNGVVKRVLRL